MGGDGASHCSWKRPSPCSSQLQMDEMCEHAEANVRRHKGPCTLDLIGAKIFDFPSPLLYFVRKCIRDTLMDGSDEKINEAA